MRRSAIITAAPAPSATVKGFSGLAADWLQGARLLDEIRAALHAAYHAGGKPAFDSCLTKHRSTLNHMIAAIASQRAIVEDALHSPAKGRKLKSAQRQMFAQTITASKVFSREIRSMTKLPFLNFLLDFQTAAQTFESASKS